MKRFKFEFLLKTINHKSIRQTIIANLKNIKTASKRDGFIILNQ